MLIKELFIPTPLLWFKIVNFESTINLAWCVIFIPFSTEHDETGKKWKWQSVKLTGTRPTPRTGMTVTPNTIGNRAYFFGGVFDDEEDEENIHGSFFNDIYCLDLEKLNFTKSKSQN